MAGRSKAFTLIAAFSLIWNASTYAGDGVLEINQACATSSGCFSGDEPGLPVTISKTGSYRLTSNLTGNEGIEAANVIGADNVTIDLNGFTIIGPGAEAPENSMGIHLSWPKNWVIRNGTIRGFQWGIASNVSGDHGHRIINMTVLNNVLDGISLGGTGHIVKDCTIRDNTRHGISLHAYSLLMGNVISGNGGWGVRFTDVGTGWGDNVINANTAGAVTGTATQVSGNVCNAAACQPGVPD